MKKDNNNNIIKVIIFAIFYFIIFVFVLSFFMFQILNHSYTAHQQNTEQTKSIKEVIENTENTEKEINTLVEIERTNTYKIFVDRETKNMYIVSNNYKNGNIQLMYDGNEPKIYKGDLNNLE